ncbi:MAG TPA: hypothetical protein ENK18_01620 [Deltaproteobacteria bacterium]|nr:hypothetical protein [Deltaproteobacteria bacterium]
MSNRNGCFLFGLSGRSTQAVLPDSAALPRLTAARFHDTDMPALRRAQLAAHRSQQSLLSKDHGVSDKVTLDLCRELSQLLQAIHRLGEHLAEARGFLLRNDTDHLARERTELELRRLGADAAQLVALKQAEAALGERAVLVERVRGEVGGLEARLVAAGQELEALCARIEARSNTEDLAHELRAYQQSAGLALDAFEATRAELGS